MDPATWALIPNSFGPAFPSFYFQTNGYAGLGVALGNSAAAVNSENDRSRDIQDAVTWTKGTHAFKLGARYLWFQAASNVRNTRNGTFASREGFRIPYKPGLGTALRDEFLRRSDVTSRISLAC